MSQAPAVGIEDNGASAAAALQGSEARKVSTSDIQLVQNLIERCLQMYMSQREVVTTLQSQAKIEPGFTGLVWQVHPAPPSPPILKSTHHTTRTHAALRPPTYPTPLPRQSIVVARIDSRKAARHATALSSTDEGGGRGAMQKLEEQNPDFFRAYYTRLKLKDQIVLFNHLLLQQVNVMQRHTSAGWMHTFMPQPALAGAL